MGWSWSVSIAQRTLLTVLRAAGLSSCSTVWVDNIYIGGHSAADVEDKLQKFDDIAKVANLTYREECRGTAITYLGMEIDLLGSTFRFTEKWVSKVGELLDLRKAGSPVPLHLLQSAVGCMVWACYLTTASMLTIRHSLRHLSYQTRKHAGAPSCLPQDVIQEWTQFTAMLSDNSPRKLRLQEFPLLPTTLTTDSSSYAAAAVHTDADGAETVRNWWWAYPQHINYLELATLGVALQDYPWPAEQGQDPVAIRWVTDNTVAEKVMKKQYSKSKPLQDILLYIQAILDLHNCTVYPEWISTHLNVTADLGSRKVSQSAPVLSPVPPFGEVSERVLCPPNHPERSGSNS